MDKITKENERALNERRARARARIVMIFLPMIIGILVLINDVVISNLFGLNYNFVQVLAVTLIFIGAAYFLMVYLKDGIEALLIDRIRMTATIKPFRVSQDSSASILQKEIDELKKKISEVSYAHIQLKEGQQEALIEELKGTISSDLAAELEKQYSSAALTTAQMRQAKDNYRQSIDRLSNEIETLTRRANLNLVIGVLTTSIAVGLLTYMVLGTDTKLETLIGILSYYVPRVTVVIFIEVFSFFFLKMYKSNLSEIKYYQQEITKISTQQIVYESAILSDDNGTLLSFVNTALNQGRKDESEDSIEDRSMQIEHLSRVVQETSKIISSLSRSTKK